MTHDPALVGFTAGAASLGFLVIGLFFLKFWRKTRDALFLSFAAAFLLLAIGRAVLGLAEVPNEDVSQVYLLRLAAFLIIIFAVLRKNMKRR